MALPYLLRRNVANGLIDSEGLNLSFSKDVDLVGIIEKIARREGLGDLLAEGSWRAAQQIGKGAEKFSMTVKKNEMTPFEARSDQPGTWFCSICNRA